MKRASLNYSRDFRPSPMTGWAGPASRIDVQTATASGQLRKPERMPNPYFTSRKMWCVLTIEIDGLALEFAGPEELEEFIEVMSTKPMPTSKTFQARDDENFFNTHWLSRLPAKAKTPKFAGSFLKYIESEPPELKEWTAFFQSGWATK